MTGPDQPTDANVRRSKIVLTGFMGTGKSTVGRIVATELGFDFVDTDDMIESVHGPIPEIFRTLGEAAFREMERQVAASLAERENLVISTGGRLMLDPANVASLAPTSQIYCLTAPAPVILRRATAAPGARPLLDTPDPEQRIAELLAERGPSYRRFIQVPTHGSSPQAVAERIVTMFHEPGERLIIRPAQPDDADLIHRLIVGLAVYEREPDAVEATPESIRAQIESSPPPFECLIAELGDDSAADPVGFALFFSNYSTWKGKTGIYLEDLFVLPDRRGTGAGKALLASLAQIAVERGCARLEWQVLDWNEPSIRFYEALGAEVMRDWLPCRLTGDSLEALARTQKEI